MANVQVRGCCCGIPFGCGTLALAGGLAYGLWEVATSSWLPSWIGMILP